MSLRIANEFLEYSPRSKSLATKNSTKEKNVLQKKTPPYFFCLDCPSIGMPPKAQKVHLSLARDFKRRKKEGVLV